MKKLLCLLIVLVFACSAMAEVATNELGKTPVVLEDGVTLTVALTQNTDVIDYATSWTATYWHELSGMTIEPYVMPSADAVSKMTAMVADPNTKLPDIMLSDVIGSWANLNSFAEAGALVALDEYFERDSGYSDLFYARCEEAGLDADAVLNEIRCTDGHIYAFPIYDMKIPNIYCNRAYINKDFLEALDMEVPTTIDELTDYLIAVRDGDPNGNGIADEIPMTGTTGWTSNGNALCWLQNMFCYMDGTANRYDRLDNTDGELVPVYDTEEYREFLKYVNMLVSEGLLDVASFTQSTSEMRKGLQADVQTAGLMCGSANGFGNNIASWDPIEQPEGYYGTRQVTYWRQNIGFAFAISKDCENVEAVVKFAMLGYDGDEVGLCMRYGEPEVDWRYAYEGEESVFKEMGLAAHIKCLNVTWAVVTDKSWQQSTGMPYLADASTHIEVFDGNEIYGERYHGRSVSMNYMYAPDETAVAHQLRYTDEELEQWNDKRTALQTYVEEATNRFCMGQLDPNSDEDWAAYLAELEKLQYKEIVELDNEVYERMYG